MNVNHFGIVITLIVLAILLSVAFVSQNHINIIPEQFQHNYSMDTYCKQFNIKC
jgi:hypothetical protein